MKKNATPAEKMAAAVDACRSHDETRALLAREYHDKEAGCVVATDSRRLIVTNYNFNPCFENVEGVYPNYFQVIPRHEKAFSATLRFEAGRGGLSYERMRKVCKAASRLADATGQNAYLWFAVAGKVALFNPDFIADLSLAMEADGTLQFSFDVDDPENAPACIYGKRFLAVLMPIRGSEAARGVYVNGTSGEVENPDPKAIAEAWTAKPEAERQPEAVEFPAWFEGPCKKAAERAKQREAEEEARRKEALEDVEARDEIERLVCFLSCENETAYQEALNKWERMDEIEKTQSPDYAEITPEQKKAAREAWKAARGEFLAWLRETAERVKAPATVEAVPVEAVEDAPAVEAAAPVAEVVEAAALPPPPPPADNVEAVESAPAVEDAPAPAPAPVEAASPAPVAEGPYFVEIGEAAAMAAPAGTVYAYHTDGGHGWLAVPVAELLALGIADKISRFSYVSNNRETAFLEEDDDAGVFLKAYKERRGARATVFCVRDGDYSPIRDLPRFEAPAVSPYPRPVPVVDAGDLSTRQTLENVEKMLAKVIDGTHGAPSVALDFIQEDLRKVRATLEKLEVVRDWGLADDAVEAVRAMTA